MKVSAIITNWNGLDILKKSLETILKNSPEVDEFILIDDGSTDQSINYIKKIQNVDKRLKLIQQPSNQGFIPSSNRAVKACRGDIVVLLNNDIFPVKGYISNGLKHFNDPDVFGVGFAEVGNENYPRIFWKEGYLQYEPIFSTKAHNAAWVSGGSSMVRRNLFEKLGGFDKVYEPFYSEDLDLGYRAWKSGYKIIWEPSSKVFHKHESTTSRLNKRFTDYIKERNRLLTVYRNITDKDLLFSNLRGIIFRILLGPNYIKIVRAANKQIKNYPSPICLNKLSDREVFNIFSQ